ncbi:betaine aldehyde dehydrogenase [Grosmannia clavigera kw1407]|uniref:aldehyde dehydrogenase (NAD(+)) n=1 Tax=Grosmannia clavigera (strain kw1407 / UAMH 11150) TaxID=655863 RepID=F0XAY3_GROCL|nr:betaine aldehyde dehydrogenase [Grosmannia clavigera kw1407]EFX05180.1 betaine aldehyde dehydrogenase [Grosmannia clavigera kw1407]
MAELDRHTYYGGKPQPAASSDKSFFTINPATAEPLARIFTSSAAAVDAAVESAQAAFSGWANTLPVQRSRILRRASELLRERNDALARIETLDSGKPFSETSVVDVVTGADVLEYYAGLIASGGLNGEYFALRPGWGGATVHTAKEPLGVCAAIGAWNYPLQIALWKSAPCLAAGNTLVYKPSEFTPLHAQLLADVYRDAGLPEGVFNVVYGAGDVGARLVDHKAVAKVSFTGQVSTGRRVAGAAAGQLKYVTMELGGKSPLIVLPDADPVGQAVDGAMMANFYSSGQVCTNGTRVFVPAAMLPEFERLLLQKLQYVRAGDLFDPATNYGPVSSALHRDKVLSHMRTGRDVDRARLLAGGDTVVPPGIPPALSTGFWLAPTVFTDCTDDMAIVREEIFGPVMCILPYTTVEEAVRRANNTDLGLAAGVFGRDINHCHQVVNALQAGITWVNTWGESPAEMAVGGWKQSGVGVENGHRGLEAWLRNKSTLIEMSGVVPTVFGKL